MEQHFDTPADALAHYGVKGMKWGVRKDEGPAGELVLSQECKNGTQLNVYKDSRYSDDVDVAADLYHTFEFRDRSGAKVGAASFYKEKADSTTLELEWIGVDKAHRSNGYARAALSGVMEYSRQNGITDLEMSATKMGQPLYESLGFTPVPGKDGTERRVLGVFKTLPRYQMHIPAEVVHSGSVKSLLDYIAKAVDNDPELNEAEHSESFDTPADALAHYGVKGMKWGVRKKDARAGRGSAGSGGDKSSDDSAALEEYKEAMRARKPLTGLEASKNLQKNVEKLHNKVDDPGPSLEKAAKREAKAAKFDERAEPHQKRIDEIDVQIAGLTNRQRFRRRMLQSERAAQEEQRDAYLKDAERAREGKLTSGQRKALVAAGVGAVVVGGLTYSAHKSRQETRKLEELAKSGDVAAKQQLYNQHVALAKTKTWMFGSYVTKESWDREEFELPEGHTFHRLSTTDESAYGYRPGTYCTPNADDFNRYVAGFRQEKGPGAEFHHVTFTTKRATKVPNLQTTVETLRETMQQQRSGGTVTRAQALAEYEKLSGGSWRGPTQKAFFENLQKKGYGAIVDEMDSGVLGEKPLVFFDSGNANAKQSRPLTSEEIVVRERAIKLMNRPPRKAG